MSGVTHKRSDIISPPNPTISLIVPVYNTAAYLPACLDSLLAQGIESLEIIAIDDGSTDRSRDILHTYAARDPRLRVITSANAGVAAARNRGLVEARGQYLWFVDSDDLLAEGALAAALTVAHQHQADIVAFNGEQFDADGRHEPVYRRPKPAGAMSGEAWLAALCRQREILHLVWLHLYRREFIQQHQLAFRVGIVHEDIAWVTHTDLLAKRLIYLDQPLYRYRRNPTSITGGNDDVRLLRRINSYFTVIEQLRDINRTCPMSAQTQQQLQAEIVGQAIQMNQLIKSLASGAARQDLRQRLKRERFWQHLWPDAVTFKRKRQIIAALWRQTIGWDG